MCIRSNYEQNVDPISVLYGRLVYYFSIAQNASIECFKIVPHIFEFLLTINNFQAIKVLILIKKNVDMVLLI